WAMASRLLSMCRSLHDSNAMVVGVGNEDSFSAAIGCNAVWPIERRGGRRAAVSAASALAISRDRRHHAGLGVNAADRVIFGIYHEDVAGCVDIELFGPIEGG